VNGQPTVDEFPGHLGCQHAPRVAWTSLVRRSAAPDHLVEVVSLVTMSSSQ
jgi:hypothetical protein